jgi:hypothetical protein
MEIVNVTKYTRELNLLFRKTHYRRFLPFFILLPLVLVVLSAIGFITGNSPLGVGYLAIIVFAGGLYAVLAVVFKKRAEKNKDKVIDTPVNTYVFTDDRIAISSKSETVSGSTNITYSAITNVIATPRIVMLYVNQVNVYIISPDSYTTGSQEELVKFLESKSVKIQRYA